MNATLTPRMADVLAASDEDLSPIFGRGEPGVFESMGMTTVSAQSLSILTPQEPSSISGGGDRELLERAAKAAGIDAQWDCPERGMMMLAPDGFDTVSWNPLTDDGDALRLAVNLEIDLHIYEGREVDAMFDGRRQTCSEPWGADGLAATRRAIVRAAASLTPTGEAAP